MSKNILVVIGLLVLSISNGIGQINTGLMTVEAKPVLNSFFIKEIVEQLKEIKKSNRIKCNKKNKITIYLSLDTLGYVDSVVYVAERKKITKVFQNTEIKKTKEIKNTPAIFRNEPSRSIIQIKDLLFCEEDIERLYNKNDKIYRYARVQ